MRLATFRFADAHTTSDYTHGLYCDTVSQISFVFQNARVYGRPVGLKQLQAPCSRLEEGVPGGDREERSSKQSLMLNSCRPSGMQLMRLRVLVALGI